MTVRSISRVMNPSLGLSEAVDYALAAAKRLGAGGAVVGVSRTTGFDLSVRLEELETVEYQSGGGLGITVYMGSRKGSSSTSDFQKSAIDDAVRAAVAIAKYTAEDPYSGLPPKDRLVSEMVDLELHQPWHVDRDQALDIAFACEQAALSDDPRIVNSEGASVSTQSQESVLGNSDGLLVVEHRTRHSVSCSVIGQTESGMQTDYWSSTARDPNALETPEAVGAKAARRTVRRLDARKIKTCSAPVMFEAPVASSLIRLFIDAISGGAQYRKASFLLDSLGQQIFPESTTISEQPHLTRGIASAVCDAEGVATASRDIVRDGVLQNYVLDSYSARKLGLETTGNAGGVFNLIISSGKRNFADLLKLMDRGLLVTQTMGFGINQVTGDYSQGVSGLWVERGEIQHPVEEVTIAGNLRDMFRSLIEVGNDVDARRAVRTGSILLADMTVAGK